MYVTWSEEKYGLGIPEIDRQHRELFLITDQLYECLEKRNERELLKNALKRLYDYTRYHFSSEEKMLVQYGYPPFAGHRDIHRGFTNSIKRKILKFRENPEGHLEGLVDFLVGWIVNHIYVEDRKYRDYFEERGTDLTGFRAGGCSSYLKGRE